MAKAKVLTYDDGTQAIQFEGQEPIMVPAGYEPKVFAMQMQTGGEENPIKVPQHWETAADIKSQMSHERAMGIKNAEHWKKYGIPPWLGYAAGKSYLGMMQPAGWLGYKKELEQGNQAMDYAYESATGEPPSGVRQIASALPGQLPMWNAAFGAPQKLGMALQPGAKAVSAMGLPKLGEAVNALPRWAKLGIGAGAGFGAQSLAEGETYTPYDAYQNWGRTGESVGLPKWAAGGAGATGDFLLQMLIGRQAIPEKALAHVAKLGARAEKPSFWSIARGKAPAVVGEPPATGGGFEAEGNKLLGLGSEATATEEPGYVKMAKARKKSKGEEPSGLIPLESVKPQPLPFVPGLQGRGTQMMTERSAVPPASLTELAEAQFQKNLPPPTVGVQPGQIGWSEGGGLTPLYRPGPGGQFPRRSKAMNWNDFVEWLKQRDAGWGKGELEPRYGRPAKRSKSLLEE